MSNRKSKISQEELLERRAQAAWEYRQRNREAVNAKARIRMRRKREALQSAPSAVQLEHTVKAAQYRRKYLECVPPRILLLTLPTYFPAARRRQASTLSSRKLEGAPPKKKLTSPTKATAVKTPVKTAAGGTTHKQLPGAGRSPPAPCTPPRCTSPTRPARPRERLPMHKFHAMHDPASPTPRSLRDIADSASDSEEEVNWDADDEDEGNEEEEEDEPAAQGRSAGPQFGPELGPVLDPSGLPEYRPLPGQRTYWREGRRYWH
ncbi:hypothetical protein C8R46DRAFT_1238300 [Mycena filopes]|nr:hypothetical protein C8R46DRAFT_1238300 [Mycena filopes]